MAKTKPKKLTMPLKSKLFFIQQDMKKVMKLGHNDFHKYDYAREGDIIAEAKPLLKEYKVLLTNNVESLDYLEEEGTKKITVFVKVMYELRDLDSDDVISMVSYGQGQDSGDKATPKALTMAMKYFLSKAFLVETGDDAEGDTRLDKKNNKDEQKKSNFEAAKAMIQGVRNVDGLAEYQENLKNSKTFDAKQKVELNELIKKRVNELS
ncbi:MAG: ERF family protein [Parcubacteria group bacterium]